MKAAEQEAYIPLVYLTPLWKKELNLISWNNREAKYDIRDWDETHEKMGKGITFNQEELKKLKDILNTLEL